MRNIFQLDNRFFTFMSKVADVMILNLLFILTCIPIVTIGASITALYCITLKQTEGKEPYIAKAYFQSWKENFRQSTILWLLMLVVGMLLFVNLSIKTTGGIYLVMRTGILTGAVFWCIIILYLFPLVSRFENTMKYTLVNAFLMSTRHLLTTIVMLAINVFCVFMAAVNPQMVPQIIMFWFLFGFVVIAKIQSRFLNKIFKCHMAASRQ